MERENWISKVYNPSSLNLLSTNELIKRLKMYFKKDEYPLLVAEIPSNGDGINQEASRGFIVSNAWPNANIFNK